MMILFLLGTMFGRLPYGPLANRIGRKKTLYLGLWISVLGTTFILSAHSYAFLCFGRFVQALGCAVTLKIGYTMVGDLHAGAAATKVLSYAMLAYAILPGIATAVAGSLTESYGWRGGSGFFSHSIWSSSSPAPAFLKPRKKQIRMPSVLRRLREATRPSSKTHFSSSGAA